MASSRSGNNLISGASLKTALERAQAGGFAHAPQPAAEVGLTKAGSPLAFTMERSHYAATFGPTAGDRVRLGDTDLIIQVEKDFAVYGDECKFGGGKVLREGQGQAAGVGAEGALDYVITNALIVDYTGIVKARRDCWVHPLKSVSFGVVLPGCRHLPPPLLLKYSC